MDTETFEQLPLDKEAVEEAIKYIKENDNATIRFYEGRAFEVQPENFVELEVIETEPVLKVIQHLVLLNQQLLRQGLP